MRKAVGAVLYHCSEAVDSESRHMFCEKDSQWCKKSIAEQKGETFEDKPGLPVAVRDKIKHIFQDLSSEDLSSADLSSADLSSADLSSEDLLKKCLHGKTRTIMRQSMDLFGSVCRKMYLLRGTHLRLGFPQQCLILIQVHMAFVFEALGMSAGYFTKEFCLQRDTTRIEKMK